MLSLKRLQENRELRLLIISYNFLKVKKINACQIYLLFINENNRDLKFNWHNKSLMDIHIFHVFSTLKTKFISKI